MDEAQQTKLDGIDVGANAYSLPTATAGALGGVKVGGNLAIAVGVLDARDATAAQEGVLRHLIIERYTVTVGGGHAVFTTTYAMEALDTTNTADNGFYSMDEYRNTLMVYINVAAGGGGAVLCDYGAAADKYHYVQTDANTITLGAAAAQNDTVTIVYTPKI